MTKRSSPANAIRRESDMYAPVKAFFESRGWDVKAEVAKCDAAGLKDGKLLAVEMKLTLNLDVILQGIERQRIADIVYLAVPRKPAAMRTKRWWDSLELLKRLNMGLLVVSAAESGYDVEELIEPAEASGSPARGRAVRVRMRAVTEHQKRTGDRNTGGVRGVKIMTAYKEAALRLAALIAGRGPMSAKQMKPEGEKSRGTYDILRYNHYNWFMPLGGGVFGLTKDGREALATYAEIIMDISSNPNNDEVFAGTVEE